MELVSCVSWVRLSVRLRLVPSLHESRLLSSAALDVPTPANANADKTAGTRTSVDLRNRRMPTSPQTGSRIGSLYRSALTILHQSGPPNQANGHFSGRVSKAGNSKLGKPGCLRLGFGGALSGPTIHEYDFWNTTL